MMHRTAGYRSPHSHIKAQMVPGNWYGYQTVMPVLRKVGARLKVRLARRPDESTTWIKRRAVVLSSTRYAILIDLSQHRLYVFHSGKQVGSYPVGVGAPSTPTPTGNYFLAFHAPPTGPGYGPVMLETSAHSKAIQYFDGGDDAIIAIHGPVGSHAEIGRHGAAISHGCVRMHNAQLRKVARVPDGAPVIITR